MLRMYIKSVLNGYENKTIPRKLVRDHMKKYIEVFILDVLGLILCSMILISIKATASTVIAPFVLLLVGLMTYFLMHSVFQTLFYFRLIIR